MNLKGELEYVFNKPISTESDLGKAECGIQELEEGKIRLETPKLAPYLALKHHSSNALVPFGDPTGNRLER